ncbi:uncharacterized protein [Elaeis guineensis]|uniref:uncharacterized protein n=1 Tax=Elaeis guineensis var. tenera TaxID=51953 RepID=UPI003C6DA8F0
MPSNPKSLMKSRAFESNVEALNLTLSMPDALDDDFQNPSEMISVAQNLILSSLRNPSSQPLKPSNGVHPRKRAKTAAASGKENRRIPMSLGFGFIVSSASDGNEARRAERRGLSSPTESMLVKGSPAAISDARVSSACDGMKVIGSESSVSVGCDERIEITEEKSRCLTSVESKVVQNGEKQETELMLYKGSHYSMSIESRLLESRAKSPFCRGEGEEKGGSFEGNDCEDFEPGTQLNELMNLCCEMGEEGNSNDGVTLSEENDFGVRTPKLQWNGIMECPLCGSDITDMSEEMRQAHTNKCLDKDENLEVPVSIHEINSNLPQKAVDVNPVLEWLRNLGLSRYEEFFVRQEVDWETLQWLTEEDLLGIGIVALGPRKKIVHALSELRKRTNHAHVIEKDISGAAANKNSRLSIPGNKLITEYFQGPVVDRNRVCSLKKTLNGKGNKDSASKSVHTRSCMSKGKARDIPPWCCIPGTPFRVDAFRYLRGDCSHWFLTHFHIDHYGGLTRNFCHGKIYCSSITAHLVNMKIGVPWDRLHILPLNQKITVAGVNLTCFDANHCPGSIIILFEPPNGKAVLHTGDFRFSAEMASNSVLQSCHVHTLILDTTYCNPQYDFPKQEAVTQFVIEAIQAEAFNPRTLFLIGSYTIGKERLFLEVARLLRKKVYVGAAKLRLLRCLGFPEEDMQWFTANEMESHIHVVPMWTLASFKRMKYISNQYSDRFDLIVAFSPSGWAFGKGRKKTPGRRWQQGTIIRYEVPYSEHCSFTELREFVQFICPEHIIPSVNNNGPESVDAMIALLMSDS